jgi:6,7-dimethyl-8-ribityllumazine synthase
MSLQSTPDLPPVTIDPSWRIAVIRSIWHPECTEALRDDAVAALTKAGMGQEKIYTIDAPGSFELPVLACHAIEKLGCTGVIAFGVVLQGQTHHARLIAEQAAAGCMQLQLQTRVPVTFEVLLVDAIDDARVRSIGAHGKGSLAAQTLLSCLARIGEMR